MWTTVHMHWDNAKDLKRQTSAKVRKDMHAQWECDLIWVCPTQWTLHIDRFYGLKVFHLQCGYCSQCADMTVAGTDTQVLLSLTASIHYTPKISCWTLPKICFSFSVFAAPFPLITLTVFHPKPSPQVFCFSPHLWDEATQLECECAAPFNCLLF